MIESEKFRIIDDIIMHDNNMLSITKMCKIAGVSRSGYYSWKASEQARNLREELDKQNFLKILKAYQADGYAKGARSIYMQLIHAETYFNLKKIRRLMKKYGLKCPYRGPNESKRMAKAIKTNTVFENVVDRKFKEKGPRKILLTDITYIFYGIHREKVCYLSTILDAYTKEILAYEISQNLKVEFVLDTVEKLLKDYGGELDDTTIIHSDRGCHYTSKQFIEKLRDNDFVQSMSRRGNCWDNAPQESFFGHMKDEINECLRLSKDFESVKAQLEKWLDYYNNRRYQWDLAFLAPSEFYQYTKTGKYPLDIEKIKKKTADETASFKRDFNAACGETARGSAPNPEV